MPIYEYFCPECKTEFELMRPISESDKGAACPHCGSEGQKLISGFAMKMSGFIQGSVKRFQKETTEDLEKT